MKSLSVAALAVVYYTTGWRGLVLLAACFAATMAILTRFLLCHFQPFSALLAATLSGALVVKVISWSDPISSRFLCW